MASCKGCGKKIVWGTTAGGQRIPLDPVPPIYQTSPVTVMGQPVEDQVGAMRTSRDYMVSHFATCPSANDFSKSKKEKPK